MNARLVSIASAHAGRPVTSDLEALRIQAAYFERQAASCVFDRWLGSREIAKARAELARFHVEREEASVPRISLGGAS